MLNEVIVMGRLTAEPELKYTSNNIPVLSFSIAVSRSYETDGKRESDFISVTAWRNTAEFVAKYFRKGAMMIVLGHLMQQRWTDDNGQNHSKMVVVADRVRFGETKRCCDIRETNKLYESEGIKVDPTTGEVVAMEGEEES
ncbi:single-stranded DNA-binding protein [Butyricicoccus sp.]|uniref:single-stranded DNA-binding protein n=1 Tax=Butyricicoccus sp. TaxID=2049021 RepID=UPI003D7C97B5